MTKRNPMARELRLNPLYRARQGKTRREIEHRADRWSRAAKHKPTKGTPGSAHGPGDLVAGGFYGRQCLRFCGHHADNFSIYSCEPNVTLLFHWCRRSGLN